MFCVYISFSPQCNPPPVAFLRPLCGTSKPAYPFSHPPSIPIPLVCLDAHCMRVTFFTPAKIHPLFMPTKLIWAFTLIACFYRRCLFLSAECETRVMGHIWAPSDFTAIVHLTVWLPVCLPKEMLGPSCRLRRVIIRAPRSQLPDQPVTSPSTSSRWSLP